MLAQPSPAFAHVPVMAPPHEALTAAAVPSAHRSQSAGASAPSSALPSQQAQAQSMSYMQLLHSYPSMSPLQSTPGQPLFYFPHFHNPAAATYHLLGGAPAAAGAGAGGSGSAGASLVDVQQQQSAFSAFISASSSPAAASLSSASSSSTTAASTASPRPPVGLAVAGLLGLSHSQSSSTSARALPSPPPLPSSGASASAHPAGASGSGVSASPLLSAPTIHPPTVGVASPIAIKAERLSPHSSSAAAERPSPPRSVGRVHADNEKPTSWSPRHPRALATQPTTLSPSSLAALSRQLTASLSQSDLQAAMKATIDLIAEPSTLQSDVVALIQACDALAPPSSASSVVPLPVVAYLLSVLSTAKNGASPPSSESPSPTPCPHCSSQKKGTRWSSSDDDAMVAMVRDGRDWEEVATKLRRTVRALKDRYCHLKKVEERRREGRDGRSQRRSHDDDGDERRSRRDREKDRRKKRRKRRDIDDSSASDSYSDSSDDRSDEDDDPRDLHPSHSSQGHSRLHDLPMHSATTNATTSDTAHERPRPPAESSRHGDEQREDADVEEAPPGLSPPTSPASPLSSSASSSSTSSLSSSSLAPTVQSSPLSSSSALLPWSATDEFRLFSFLNSGLTIRDASAQLGRTVAAVKGRLQRLKRKRDSGGHREDIEDADEERITKADDLHRLPPPSLVAA